VALKKTCRIERCRATIKNILNSPAPTRRINQYTDQFHGKAGDKYENVKQYSSATCAHMERQPHLSHKKSLAICRMPGKGSSPECLGNPIDRRIKRAVSSSVEFNVRFFQTCIRWVPGRWCGGAMRVPPLSLLRRLRQTH